MSGFYIAQDDGVMQNVHPPVVLPPSAAFFVNLHLSDRHAVAEKHLLVVDLDDTCVGRYVTLSGTDVQYPGLHPVTPYVRHHSNRDNDVMPTEDSWLVPGQKPVRDKKIQKYLPNKLKQYPVPFTLQKLTGAAVMDDVCRLVPVLKENLTLQNYSRYMSCLLFLEEMQQEVEMREFDLNQVTMGRQGDYLVLEVPGLSEGRPSVIVGDRVIAGRRRSDLKYEGYIHEVQREHVFLKFSSEFQDSYNEEELDVRFCVNRTSFRRCHQAVENAIQLGSAVLFPDEFTLQPPLVRLKRRKLSREQLSSSSGFSREFYNKCLNDEQRAAVIRILAADARPLPYVLFGPPGTGKTVTLVEVILQIFHRLPTSRIVTCTPSNSAADLLIERLHLSGLLNSSDMVRLNAFQRLDDSLSDIVRIYSEKPDQLEKVVRYRLIICTCVTAGVLFSLALKPGHVTHVLVDEAGQATEPECMIPIGLTTGCQSSQIVLAGDPQQLGPVLRSHLAGDLGLSCSFLQRLCERSLYLRQEEKFQDAYDPHLVTKLVRNYRSHEVLLTLPSQLFYHAELLVCAPRELVTSFATWTQLPNQDNCPLVFHGLKGEDMREGCSPSWFNPAEAVQVSRYLQLLLEEPDFNVSHEDIGVITPYRKQVEKIRCLIDRLGMGQIKVGSVEEFQGQERQVILISTVRSAPDEVENDLRHTLGFLSNPRRFNVAITRPQALLIVVGNPHLLAKDVHWCSLLEYCIQRQAYTGCELPHHLIDRYFPETPLCTTSENNDDVPSEADVSAVTQSSDMHPSNTAEHSVEEDAPAVSNTFEDGASLDLTTLKEALDDSISSLEGVVKIPTENGKPFMLDAYDQPSDEGAAHGTAVEQEIAVNPASDEVETPDVANSNEASDLFPIETVPPSDGDAVVSETDDEHVIVGPAIEPPGATDGAAELSDVVCDAAADTDEDRKSVV